MIKTSFGVIQYFCFRSSIIVADL